VGMAKPVPATERMAVMKVVACILMEEVENSDF
jgi:hypothetical protein